MKCLETSNIDAKGEVAVSDLYRGRTRASISTGVERLNNPTTVYWGNSGQYTTEKREDREAPKARHREVSAEQTNTPLHVLSLAGRESG